MYFPNCAIPTLSTGMQGVHHELETVPLSFEMCINCAKTNVLPRIKARDCSGSGGPEALKTRVIVQRRVKPWRSKGKR